MTTKTDNKRLVELLDKAKLLARQFSSGYSGSFLSAQKFHLALLDCIQSLKTETFLSLANLRFGFCRHLVGTIWLDMTV